MKRVSQPQFGLALDGVPEPEVMKTLAVPRATSGLRARMDSPIAEV